MPTIQKFDTSGTWTKPAGCRLVKVTVIGGGGAGGGASNGSSSNTSCGGGGGAGGGSIEWIDVTAISSETVTIGAAGTGVSGGTGDSGGTSSFGAHCSADGGTGAAIRITSGVTVTVSTAGGSGGVATGGDINNTGGAEVFAFVCRRQRAFHQRVVTRHSDLALVPLRVSRKVMAMRQLQITMALVVEALCLLARPPMQVVLVMQAWFMLRSFINAVCSGL
jgi:hypothetical protein